MASHVVVIDSSARRVTVKTTPNKYLSEVLEEACGRFGYNASQYGLKNNNKQVDVSRTFRLSGLSSGAKLELVQLSKSAGVVSVALQLPESEARGTPSARLTDKFPSSTSLWLVLRKFEAGVAGEGGGNTTRNLTARGAPSTSTGNANAGRLYYEQPVLHVMNRELANFVDLQKSLAQLGFNSGSVLLKLSFRVSETPFEEAMSQIQDYFTSVEGPAISQHQQPAPSIPQTATPIPEPTVESMPIETTAVSSPEPALQPTLEQHPISDADAFDPEVNQTVSGRPVSVFRPPSRSTPAAAQVSHSPDDYTPTIEHAQTHQKMLLQSSRNVRLPTDAELAAQQEAEVEKLATIRDVELKIRFPDQSTVSTKFQQHDTAADLYTFVRECLEQQWRNEPFILRNPGVRGKGEVIPDDMKKKLIKDLQLKGRVLVNFGWDDTKASLAARGTKVLLKEELRAQAAEIKVQDIPGLQGDPNDKGTRVNIGGNQTPAETSNADEGKRKLPKWLNKLSKK